MERRETDLLGALPHAPPFRFVSTIERLTPGESVTGTWRVTGDEDFLRGHFPGDPIVPGVLLSEALAQISGLLSGSSEARLARVDVKFPATVRPPSVVRLESTFVRDLGGVGLFDVRATTDEDGMTTVAEGRLMLGGLPC